MLLIELVGIIDGQSAVAAANSIKRDCQRFIKEWGSIPMPDCAIYRGMINSWPNILYYTKPNRTPVGMDVATQNKLDDFFQEEFGHRYRSEHSLFCTGNPEHTKLFGDVHVIFPIGKYSYIWSPEVNDINYTLLSQSTDEIIANTHFIHNKLLNKVLDHEVMINVESYYAIPIKIYKRSVYPLLIK
jgi:hypothetical protein